MGIYIKGMEMPRFGECIVITSDSVASKYLDGDVAIYIDARPDKASAAELPPHGRLFDRNELEVVSYHNSEGMKDTFDNGVKWMLEYIDKLTPVIPAAPEGGADG